ncbi:uncharacterized protein LOC112560584 [Pomacea canaliculata]|uniref:uncharacterized protein LOC112560584 n=1 Tax=Pomacea canaliculata TaxID=400727 RepID=UPI000D73BBD4|nr:uncharacterized protein LOC112560584 [Pomacea canaliculata]
MPAMRHPASFSSHLTSTPVCLESDERILVESQRPETITNGSFQYDRSNIGSLGRRVKPSNTLGYPNGEVTMRKRSKRDRLKLYRQAGRCITVQGFEGRFGGLYDDSLSDPSDSSRTDIPDDTLAVYKTMNKEDLLRVVIQNKAQLIRKDQYIKDLENYIDDLLVRVMECTPRILHRPPMHHR